MKFYNLRLEVKNFFSNTRKYKNNNIRVASLFLNLIFDIKYENKLYGTIDNVQSYLLTTFITIADFYSIDRGKLYSTIVGCIDKFLNKNDDYSYFVSCLEKFNEFSDDLGVQTVDEYNFVPTYIFSIMHGHRSLGNRLKEEEEVLRFEYLVEKFYLMRFCLEYLDFIISKLDNMDVPVQQKELKSSAHKDELLRVRKEVTKNIKKADIENESVESISPDNNYDFDELLFLQDNLGNDHESNRSIALDDEEEIDDDEEESIALEDEEESIALEDEEESIALEDEEESIALDDEEDSIALDDEEESIALDDEEEIDDDEEESIALEDEEESIALDDEEDSIALEDEEESIALEDEEEIDDDEEESIALEDEEESIALDDEEESIALDDEEESIALDDEEESIALEDEEESIALEDEEESIALEDEEESIALEDEEESIALEDEEESIALDDEEESIALEDEEEIDDDEEDSIALEDEEESIALEDEEEIDDDEEESIALDDEEDSIALDDEEDSIALDDEEDSIALEDEEESIALEDEEESIALDDEEESIALDDEEESIALEDEEESIALEDEEESIALEDEEESIALEDEEESIALEDEEESIALDDEEAVTKPINKTLDKLLNEDWDLQAEGNKLPDQKVSVKISKDLHIIHNKIKKADKYIDKCEILKQLVNFEKTSVATRDFIKYFAHIFIDDGISLIDTISRKGKSVLKDADKNKFYKILLSPGVISTYVKYLTINKNNIITLAFFVCEIYQLYEKNMWKNYGYKNANILLHNQQVICKFIVSNANKIIEWDRYEEFKSLRKYIKKYCDDNINHVMVALIN